MTLEQLVSDAIEIADHARRELGKDKIVLAGQSWGSIIGWQAIRARPDLFHAFVGTGQAVSWARTLASQEAYARVQAQAAGDEEALAALETAKKLPADDFNRTAPLRRWTFTDADLVFIEMQKNFVGAPPIPEDGEVADWVNGFGFSAEALSPNVAAFDAYKSGPKADIPVVLIQGRDDRITPTDVVAQFAKDLHAPAKVFAEIEGGHFACYTNPEAFAAALATHVGPLAT